MFCAFQSPKVTEERSDVKVTLEIPKETHDFFSTSCL